MFRQTSYIYIKGIFLLFCLFLFGCANNSQNDLFKKEYVKILAENNGVVLFNKLLILDEQYPGELELKIALADLFLKSADYESAAIYLSKGEKLIDTGSKKEMISRLYDLFIDYAMAVADYENGLNYIEKAILIEKEKAGKLSFRKARCLFYKNDKITAYDVYAKGWNKERENMESDDMIIYLELLIEKKAYNEALGVIHEYQQRFEYIIGMGIKESMLYEIIGKLDKSIYCAYMDLEYQRYYGMVEVPTIINKLEELEKALKTSDLISAKEGKGIINFLKAFTQGKWEDTYEYADSIESDHPFCTYLKVVSLMECGNGTLEDLENYTSIEQYFKSLPAYYYHFWRGMKNGAGDYNFDTAKEILEKCLLLSTKTGYAKETRNEIGRLLGLEKADNEKLMLEQEIDYELNQMILTGNINHLDNIINFLALPDNIYQIYAVLVLKKLKSINMEVREYLENANKKATGRLIDRLRMILS